MDKYKRSLLLAVCAICSTLMACHKVKVGYLDASLASFTPNVVEAYKEVDETSNWAMYGSPFTSLRIQGVAGTMPINYEFVDVQATEGGDAESFRQCVREGSVRVAGGIMQMFPKACRQLPVGRYTISLRVYNEDHEERLKDIFTFVVKQKQEE